MGSDDVGDSKDMGGRALCNKCTIAQNRSQIAAGPQVKNPLHECTQSLMVGSKEGMHVMNNLTYRQKSTTNSVSLIKC